MRKGGDGGSLQNGIFNSGQLTPDVDHITVLTEGMRPVWVILNNTTSWVAEICVMNQYL